MAGIYIHIPFCTKKCNYCNFFSVASTKDTGKFTEALLKEMLLQKDYLKGETVHTIYFGGGTPSLLPVHDLSRMIAEVQKLFPLAENMEVTMEANPDNINSASSESLAAIGINRISIGVQSFYNADLEYLGRRHTAQNAMSALDALLAGPVREISADLIYGIPTLTDEHWKKNLEILVQKHIPHISAYALTVEEKTPLFQYISKGSRARPDEEQSARQFEMMMDYLETMGYEHYEISNFCLPGHTSRHNTAYWQGIPYLGLGPSSHSYNGISRQWNCSNLTEYLATIGRNELPCVTETLTLSDKYNEFVMTSIRTSKGVDFMRLKDVFGDAMAEGFFSMIEIMIRKGWVEKNNESYVLTRAGKLFADRVAGELFIVR